jgi:hypothetical protein
MKKSTLVKTVLITAALPLFAGCVERHVVYRDRPVYVQQPPPNAEVVVEQPSEPPPPQVEFRPAPPDPTYVWVGGVWEWRGRWVWLHGHWDRPHPGHVWMGGHWEPREHGSVWISAGWR